MRVIRKVPELMDHFISRSTSLLSDKNHGVLHCGITLVTDMCAIDEETLQGFRKVSLLSKDTTFSYVVNWLASSYSIGRSSASPPSETIDHNRLFTGTRRIRRHGSFLTNQDLASIKITRKGRCSSEWDHEWSPRSGSHKYGFKQECRKCYLVRSCLDHFGHWSGSGAPSYGYQYTGQILEQSG